MAGYDGMGALSAHRQRAAAQMPDAVPENLLRGAVVDGQPHADAGDLDVAHDAAAVGVQKRPVGVIGGQLTPGKGRAEAGIEGFIVFPRRFPQGGVILRGEGSGALGVVCDQAVLSVLVPQVAGHRVKQDAQSQQEDEDRQHGAQPVLSFLFGAAGTPGRIV